MHVHAHWALISTANATSVELTKFFLSILCDGHGVRGRGRGAALGLGPERHCSRSKEITNEKRTERERGERTESQEISTRKVVISNLAYTHHCTVPVYVCVCECESENACMCVFVCECVYTSLMLLFWFWRLAFFTVRRPSIYHFTMEF